MSHNIERGAKIVIDHWMRVRRWDKLLIVTTKEHLEELRVLKEFAAKRTRSPLHGDHCRDRLLSRNDKSRKTGAPKAQEIPVAALIYQRRTVHAGV